MLSSQPELGPGSVASESQLVRITLDECGKLGVGAGTEEGKEGHYFHITLLLPHYGQLPLFVRACTRATLLVYKNY